MGILESVIGNLMGGAAGGASSPMGGGGQAGGLGNTGMAGGLSGLVSKSEQAGLGHVAQSWVGNGPNQPISPQQLQTVFGQDQV